jgi:hypothetical protein
MTDQPHSQPRPVTFDLMAADDTYFVLTDALREFASRQRWEAEDDPAGNAPSRVQWAEAAEGMLDRIEDAFSARPRSEHPKGATSPEATDVQMVTVARADLRLAMSALRDLAAHGMEPLGEYAGRLTEAAGQSTTEPRTSPAQEPPLAAAAAAPCGSPATCAGFGHQHSHIDDAVSVPGSGRAAEADLEAGR